MFHELRGARREVLEGARRAPLRHRARALRRLTTVAGALALGILAPAAAAHAGVQINHNETTLRS